MVSGTGSDTASLGLAQSGLTERLCRGRRERRLAAKSRHKGGASPFLERGIPDRNWRKQSHREADGTQLAIFILINQ